MTFLRKNRDNITEGATGAAVETQSLEQSFPTPHRYEDKLIDSFIANQTPASIFTLNKYQKHAVIRSHDDNVIVVADDSCSMPALFYKHAISTIMKDCSPEAINKAKQIASTNSTVLIPFISELSLRNQDIESYWLDNFMKSGIKIAFFTTCGVPTYGFITGYDEGVIEFFSKKYQTTGIIYKHALSSIMPDEWSPENFK